MTKDNDLMWELVDSTVDRQYNLFSLRINKNKSPRTGKIHEFQVLESPDWVAVLALTPDRELILVNQYRHGTARLSLEPPGGLVKRGQTPEQSAREELEEETGYVAQEMKLLASVYPVPAILSNRFHVFVAENAESKGFRNPDETEDLETMLVPINRVKSMIKSGQIDCGVMIAAFQFLWDYLEDRERDEADSLHVS